MKNKFYLLTVTNDEGVAITHAFLKFDNAVKHVEEEIVKDFQNCFCHQYAEDFCDADGNLTEDGRKYVDEANESLKKLNCWLDVDNTRYDIEEKEFEDEE